MKKNTNKNTEKTYKADEVLTMFESINDNVAVIAEQNLGINNRLDNIESNLDTMKSDISDIKYDFKAKSWL